MHSSAKGGFNEALIKRQKEIKVVMSLMNPPQSAPDHQTRSVLRRRRGDERLDVLSVPDPSAPCSDDAMYGPYGHWVCVSTMLADPPLLDMF
jgi:hypothetical protein